MTEQANTGHFEDAVAAYDKGDYATATRTFRSLADLGAAGTQCNLGTMYEEGRGVTQDYAEAVKWYRKAAEQGYAPGQSNLGNMYAMGRGVPQDYVQAHMWFNLAASGYPASEPEQLKAAAKKRDDIASLMTPAQVAEAQKLAREWKPKKEK